MVECHLPQVQTNADDTQRYYYCAEAVEAMQGRVADFRKWMVIDRLKLNDDKTEFIVIGTRQHQLKVNIDSLCVGGTTVSPSTVVKNLGCCLDNHSKWIHIIINKTCKSAFFHLHNIRRIRKFLSFEITQT